MISTGIFIANLYIVQISVLERAAAQVMEKSCQPQTEQMCNPPKKQPTQEKVHQVGDGLKTLNNIKKQPTQEEVHQVG